MRDRYRGPVAYMAKNGVAADLLLFFLLFSGIFALGSLVQEVFPEFSLDTVQVSVVYPGATPEEVEESIVRKIEEQIDGVEGIKEITASASEGLGVVTVELKLGTDVSRALDDIKAEVDRIPTFPVRAERPEVRELTNRSSVVRLAIFGDASERTIKELAYRTEDALSALPEISYVQTSGVRPYEISIEVSTATLRALGLTLSDISDAVRRGSLDLSAGSIETRDQEVRVRTISHTWRERSTLSRETSHMPAESAGPRASSNCPPASTSSTSQPRGMRVSAGPEPLTGSAMEYWSIHVMMRRPSGQKREIPEMAPRLLLSRLSRSRSW